jgi:hypothetical protein
MTTDYITKRSDRNEHPTTGAVRTLSAPASLAMASSLVLIGLATLESHREIASTNELAAMPCGAWCTDLSTCLNPSCPYCINGRCDIGC